MSDRFHPVSPARTAAWVFRELDQKNSVFGIPRELFYVPGGEPFTLVRNGRRLETPVGVAAGPHTQMAQNLVVAWLLGARFLELKTVQTLDELDVTKPCIDAADLTYNCEWSQELRLPESLREYLVAWVIIHALKHRLGWGPGAKEPGFEFNVSVGYNLEGIQRANVQEFLDRATVDAGAALGAVIEEVAQVYPAVRDLAIPARMADSVTLSTMHGCPPDEIERIARYLIEDRGLHTTVKLNPTLLGPAALREILNERLGHRDVTVPDEAFAHDLKYDDAVAMIRRLQAAATARGVAFGLKLTNTLETQNVRHVLPEKERMHYLSGRALHPLTLALARKLLDELQATVPMSLSGGADAFNLPEILACGLAPVTVCTDLLRPGGYARLPQYLRLLREAMRARRAADLEDWIVKSATTQPEFGDEALRLLRDAQPRLPADAVTKLERRMPALQAALEDPFAESLRRLVPEGPANLDLLRVGLVRAGQRLNAARYAENLVSDPSYAAIRRPYRAKGDRALGWFDCIAAPCQLACPAGQNIPDYLHFVAAGDDGAAIREILDTNALPCITGAVCDHPCVTRCVRNHYDDPLAIREIKRYAASNADFRSSPDSPRVERVAIVGAGPAGLSAAYVLAQAGVGVTLLEARDGAGGMAARVIPSFRLPAADLERDLARVRDLGVDLRLGVRFGVDVDIARLREEGYHALILATGAPGGRLMGIAGEDAAGVTDGLSFLTEVRAGRPVDLGEHVLVVGGGNAAMDAARTAWRVAPAAEVGLLYRRTRAEMPADADEIEAALAEGITLHELAMPTRVKAVDGRVVAVECVRMELGAPDQSGRRAPVPVPGSEHERPCTALIVCVSQAPELRFLDGSGVKVSRHETVVADEETGETSIPGIFAGGDVVRGPATVIKAVRDGQRIAETFLTRRQVSVPRRPRRLPKGLSDGELLRRRAERQPREPQEERPADARRDLEEVVAVMSEESARQESSRCLVCNEMCSLCVTVCPNRANQAYEVPPTVRSMPAYRVGAGALHELAGRVVRVSQRIQIVNVTNLCNECGNCATFCPTAGAPYRDKPRLHLDRESYAAERDRALLVERAGARYLIRARIGGEEHLLRQDGRTLAYQSPRLLAVLDVDDLGVLEARPGPEAVEGDVLGLEVALFLNVILLGLTRSLPHLF